MLFSQSLWADRTYQFNIFINDYSETVTIELDKENHFNVEVPIESIFSSHLWRFQVTSPDLPSYMYRSSWIENKVVITLRYQDPMFSTIDFEKMSFESLIFYLNNEDEETQSSVVRALSRNLRLDIFEMMLDGLEPDEWKHISDSYLIGLQEIYQSYPLPAVRNLMSRSHDSGIFSLNYTSVMLVSLGLLDGSKLRELKIQISRDNELKEFVKELSLISPNDQAFKYLLI